MDWEVVIGLEIHTQLATVSKIFSGAPTTYGAQPNSQACLVDLGYPGVLPVLNEQAVRMAIKFGLATDCEISRRSVFARKNYFYPDLPKGYQISQFELPIAHSGHLDIVLDSGKVKTIGLTRAHLEEDAGKSLHENFQGASGIDLNRAGTPLLEIVSEPDLRSSSEAGIYMRKIHALVLYLGISDGNMQEGSFRCDANVSIRRKGEQELGTRTELKNLNSFRFVEKAIDLEVERQIEIIEDGGQVFQETRLYDADKSETRSMRGKEEANDYRYFPDPDLLPLVINDALIEELQKDLPELPNAKRIRFERDFGLSRYDASVLTSSPDMAIYFERTVDSANIATPKLIANWVQGALAAALNQENLDITESKISPDELALLNDRIADNTLSGKLAKDVFEAMWRGEGSVDEIIDKRGLKQISDSDELERLVENALLNNPNQVKQFQEGNQKVIGFFVGQIMKASSGKANPQRVNEILQRKLNE